MLEKTVVLDRARRLGAYRVVSGSCTWVMFNRDPRVDQYRGTQSHTHTIRLGEEEVTGWPHVRFPPALVYVMLPRDGVSSREPADREEIALMCIGEKVRINNTFHRRSKNLRGACQRLAPS
jgi:hypothetical protein